MKPLTAHDYREEGCIEEISSKKDRCKKVFEEKFQQEGQSCWDGYEPTPGKKPGTKGSCKPE